MSESILGDGRRSASGAAPGGPQTVYGYLGYTGTAINDGNCANPPTWNGYEPARLHVGLRRDPLRHLQPLLHRPTRRSTTASTTTRRPAYTAVRLPRRAEPARGRRQRPARATARCASSATRSPRRRGRPSARGPAAKSSATFDTPCPEWSEPPSMTATQPAPPDVASPAAPLAVGPRRRRGPGDGRSPCRAGRTGWGCSPSRS